MVYKHDTHTPIPRLRWLTHFSRAHRLHCAIIHIFFVIISTENSKSSKYIHSTNETTYSKLFEHYFVAAGGDALKPEIFLDRNEIFIYYYMFMKTSFKKIYIFGFVWNGSKWTFIRYEINAVLHITRLLHSKQVLSLYMRFKSKVQIYTL